MSILKKKKTKSTFSSVGPNCFLSMDGTRQANGISKKHIPIRGIRVHGYSQSKTIVYSGLDI